jgi:hypothetical protein
MRQLEVTDTFYVGFIRFQEEYWLLTGRNGIIAADPDIDVAMDWFEGAYQSGMKRGYEAAMSAAINWLTLQPSIVQLTGTTVTELINFPASKYTIGGIAGRVTALKFDDQVRAKELFDAGIKPALIKEEWL